MSYIEDGNIQGGRSYLRLSIIPEAFWGVVNFIGSFLSAIISPGVTGRANPRDNRNTPRLGGRPPGFGRGPGGPGGPKIAGCSTYKGVGGG